MTVYVLNILKQDGSDQIGVLTFAGKDKEECIKKAFIYYAKDLNDNYYPDEVYEYTEKTLLEEAVFHNEECNYQLDWTQLQVEPDNILVVPN